MVATENKIEIKRMVIDEVSQTFDLVQRFFDEGWRQTMTTFNPKNIYRMLYSSVTTPGGQPEHYIAKDEGKVIGIISVIVSPSYFDDDQIVATELMWFVDKAYRGKKVGNDLLKYLEKEMKARGNIYLLLLTAGHYTIKTGKDKALDHYYKRKGYEKLEVHYVKKMKEGG